MQHDPSSPDQPNNPSDQPDDSSPWSTPLADVRNSDVRDSDVREVEAGATVIGAPLAAETFLAPPETFPTWDGGHTSQSNEDTVAASSRPDAVAAASAGLWTPPTTSSSASSTTSSSPLSSPSSTPSGSTVSGAGVRAAGPGGWMKPALVGGLVGALLSSAVLGSALVATRNDNAQESKTAQAPIATTTASNGGSSDKTSPNLSPSITNIQNLLERVEPAVVSIATSQGFVLSEFQEGSGAGTGMVVTSDGYILTNNHVIAGATSVKVTFHDRKVRNAIVVGIEPANDVALLKVDAKDLPTVTIGSSKAARVGDDVLAIGNALALPGGPTVTAGIVSALDRRIEAEEGTLEGLVQTDTAINPGNSGGPLVNSKGEVIGMNTAIIRNTANIGFAIASDTFKPILEKLQKNALAGGDLFRPRTFLGVSMFDISKDLVERYNLGASEGVLVADVNIGSPADNAGLQAGDVVQRFDDKDVRTSEKLKELVQARKPGDIVTIEWVTRDKRKLSAKVELGAARRTSQPLQPAAP